MTFRFLGVACVLLGTAIIPGFAQDANRDEVNTVTDARTVVRKLGDRTGEFKSEFDSAIDHSLIDGTKLEDKAKHRADDLHDAAKKLQDVFGDKRDKNDPKVRDRVDKTLAAAADVNRVMVDHRFTDKLQRQWELLRVDLNALASIYGLSPL
jgi:hypothetical protein